ncbi:hypothetical protein DRO69_08220 [Candidatus Bathyarchaeota archaeon]|nr:MAG: hypothetical protein DRO69_08220 [Candidatus Bathyarchaeota archaeon]
MDIKTIIETLAAAFGTDKSTIVHILSKSRLIIEFPNKELSEIEKQLADLKFQKDSGFITLLEYNKKKQNLKKKGRK